MAKIVFRPTCSHCLKILNKKTIDFHYDDGTALFPFIRDYKIEPIKCPYCGELFEGIVMPTAGKFPVKDSYLMELVENFEY